MDDTDDSLQLVLTAHAARTLGLCNSGVWSLRGCSQRRTELPRHFLRRLLASPGRLQGDLFGKRSALIFFEVKPQIQAASSNPLKTSLENSTQVC